MEWTTCKKCFLTYTPDRYDKCPRCDNHNVLPQMRADETTGDWLARIEGEELAKLTAENATLTESLRELTVAKNEQYLEVEAMRKLLEVSKNCNKLCCKAKKSSFACDMLQEGINKLLKGDK